MSGIRERDNTAFRRGHRAWGIAWCIDREMERQREGGKERLGDFMIVIVQTKNSIYLVEATY